MHEIGAIVYYIVNLHLESGSTMHLILSLRSFKATEQSNKINPILAQLLFTKRNKCTDHFVNIRIETRMCSVWFAYLTIVSLSFSSVCQQVENAYNFLAIAHMNGRTTKYSNALWSIWAYISTECVAFKARFVETNKMANQTVVAVIQSSYLFFRRTIFLQHFYSEMKFINNRPP